MNKLLLAVHKLLSIATLVLFYFAVKQSIRPLDNFSDQQLWSGVTAFLFLIGIVTGALLSFEKPALKAILIAHKINSLLLVVSTGITVSMMF